MSNLFYSLMGVLSGRVKQLMQPLATNNNNHNNDNRNDNSNEKDNEKADYIILKILIIMIMRIALIAIEYEKYNDKDSIKY